MGIKRPYESIHDWMERTGTHQTTLSLLSGIERTFLCKILSRSRRCSLENALRLSAVSGVPVEKLFKTPWPSRKSRSKATAQVEATQ